MIRVLILTDIRLYHEGLTQVLARDPYVRVCGVAGDLHTALSLIDQRRPDVALVDLAMAGSLAAVRAIRLMDPASKIIALGVPDIEADLLACAEAGVAGYVSRAAGIDDLIATIQRAGRGELLCSPRVAAALRERLTSLADGQESLETEPHLTSREREILALVEQGLSNKDIARQLGIEVPTVKNHVHNVLDKLRVHRRGQAAARLRGTAPQRASSRRSTPTGGVPMI